jgi:hypothetical protein
MGKRMKPCRLRREVQRAEISAMYLAGRTMEEIGRAVNLNKSNVSRHLAAIRKEWVEKAQTNIKKVIAEKIAELDQIRRECWKAWHRSKRPRVNTYRTKRSDGSGRVTTVTTDPGPNASYMDIILRCWELECELFGLFGRHGPEKTSCPAWKPIEERDPNDPVRLLLAEANRCLAQRMAPEPLADDSAQPNPGGCAAGPDGATQSPEGVAA